MNKRINKSKFVACMLAAGFMAIGSGCTDSNFDLSNIDSTIGLGGEGLQLPTSGTEDMILDNVLDIKNSDFIKIAENGDYMFVKEAEGMKPAHPSVDKVVLKEAKINNDFKIIVPKSALMQVQRKKRGQKRNNLASVNGKASEFKYHGMTPNEIRDITPASTSAELKIHVKVSNELKKVVPTFKTLTFNMPKFMKLKLEKCTPSQPEYDEKTGVVTFKNVLSSDNINLVADVNKLDFSMNNDGENSINFTAGKEGKNGSVDLNGVTNMGITFDDVDLTNNSTDDLFLSTDMSLGDITVNEATGKFNPQIDLDDLGSMNVNDVPDFLTDKDVAINLYNPVIELTVSSDADIAGIMNGTLTAEDKAGNMLANIDIPGLNINPNSVTRICICKHAEEIDKTKYDQVKEVSNLSDLVKKIPHDIVCKADAKADAKREGTLELGKEYTIEATSFIKAPLAFDEGAQIVYTDTIDGWNEDIDKFSFTEGAYIEMTTDVENKIPAYLNVKAYAIDVNGNEIAEDRIRVDVSNSVKASEDSNTAVTTPVTLQMHESAKGALKDVDGIVMRIAAASGEEGQKSIVGQTLNAYKHTLKAHNIKVRLVGRIIGDFN